MNEVIVYSSGDVVVEFGNGPFCIDVPLHSLIFDRGRTCVVGSFVITTEIINSSRENVFDTAHREASRFNIHNIRPVGVALSRKTDDIDHVIIFKTRTIMPPGGGLCKKVYYFTSGSLDIECDIVEPPEPVSPTVVNVTNTMPRPLIIDADELNAMMETAIRRAR